MFSCNQCAYSTKIKCNYVRHTKTCKSRYQNNTIEDQNNTIDDQNNTMNTKQSFIHVGSKMRCVFCLKEISCKYTNRHLKVCKGCPLNTCRYCDKTFGRQQHVSRHEKTCGYTEEVHGNNDDIQQTVPCTIINNNDNSTTNNITNNIQQININVHGKENYEALLDTIRTKYPQAFVTMVEEGDTASLLKLVHFNKDFPENQTIRKPIKKDVSAEIHLGEGRWERRPTHEVIETFKGQTSKRLCNSLQTIVNNKDKQNDMYLKEIMYEQSKEPSGNTDSLLQPFMMSEQDFAEKDLIKSVMDIKYTMMKEYPSLIGTKMFINQWKKESKAMIHAFENEWNTVVDNINWSHS